MATITISVGNNSKEGYLTPNQWEHFARHINSMFDSLTGDESVTRPEVYVKAAPSIGEWDGQSELSLTWVAGVDDRSLEAVRGWLEVSATMFKQQAIALTVGTTEFIGGFEEIINA